MTPPSRAALVIINPLSGRGRRQSQIEAHVKLAQDVLGANGYDVVVRPTTQAGDAHAFARQAVASNMDLVIAWGGDGTVNETASALIHSEVALGIVPAGSGNGLAGDLLIPFDARAALRLAATGRTVTIDAGQVNDSLFFNIAGVGIDAVIAARFSERGIRKRGPLAYVQLTASELLRYNCQTYDLTLDGERASHRAMLVAFANGRQFGNRMFIAPGARLDDGLLEVVIVEDLPIFEIARRLPSLYRGTLMPGRGVFMRAAQSCHVKSVGPIPFHVDGEPRLGSSEITVRTHRAALRVRAAGT